MIHYLVYFVKGFFRFSIRFFYLPNGNLFSPLTIILYQIFYYLSIPFLNFFNLSRGEMSSPTFLRLQCGNGRHFGSVLLFPLNNYIVSHFCDIVKRVIHFFWIIFATHRLALSLGFVFSRHLYCSVALLTIILYHISVILSRGFLKLFSRFQWDFFTMRNYVSVVCYSRG